MNIITRAQWNARPPKSRVTGDTVTETYLHHTASAHSGAAGVRAIQTFHMDSRGWSDIAYNFVIDPDTLTVYEGRGWGVRPGSQKSHNRGTWSVCVMGNYQTKQPTQGLLSLVAELTRFGHSRGEIPLELTGGHKDAPGQTTSCPGAKLYPTIPTIRELLEDDMSQYGPENWDAADWAAFDERGGKAAWAGGYTILGRHPNTVLRNVEAMVGALDIEGVSEAELDERVANLKAVLPAAFVAKLKESL